MYGKIQQHLLNELNTIEQNGIFKRERIITSTQGAEITVNGKTVLNFCAMGYVCVKLLDLDTKIPIWKI